LPLVSDLMAEPAGNRLEGVLGQRERFCFTPGGVNSPTSRHKRPEYMPRDQAVSVTEFSSLSSLRRRRWSRPGTTFARR
jgi:hypothetical protein